MRRVEIDAVRGAETDVVRGTEKRYFACFPRLCTHVSRPSVERKTRIERYFDKRAPFGAPLVLLVGIYFSNANCISQDSRISSMSRSTATLSSGRKVSLCDRPACAHRVTSRISYSKPLTSGGHSTV